MEKFDIKKYAEWCKQNKKDSSDTSNIVEFLKEQKEVRENETTKTKDAELQKVFDAMCKFVGLPQTELTTAKGWVKDTIESVCKTVIFGQTLLDGADGIANALKEKLGE